MAVGVDILTSTAYRKGMNMKEQRKKMAELIQEVCSPPIAYRAIRNMNKYYKKSSHYCRLVWPQMTRARGLYAIIDKSFCWLTTREGSEYWASIAVGGIYNEDND